MREILQAIGEDPDRDGLQDTPKRVAKAYAELFAGLHQDPAELLGTTFDIEHDELVLVKDIPFYSTCEHHLVPFHGHARTSATSPGPTGKVTGLSKLARLVELYARRPQVQERLTTQIVEALMDHLDPPRRDRRRRVRTPVHVDARGPQARRQDRHQRRARPAARARPPAPRR